MTRVNFYDTVDDALIQFAVILSRAGGKWVLCKHRDRTTLEIPGGHRESGETVEKTARRELYEETGAVEFTLRPVCIYSVSQNGQSESFGGLYYADIAAFEPELYNEIEKIVLADELPEGNWTYPDIQPRLIEEARRRGLGN